MQERKESPEPSSKSSLAQQFSRQGNFKVMIDRYKLRLSNELSRFEAFCKPPEFLWQEKFWADLRPCHTHCNHHSKLLLNDKVIFGPSAASFKIMSLNQVWFPEPSIELQSRGSQIYEEKYCLPIVHRVLLSWCAGWMNMERVKFWRWDNVKTTFLGRGYRSLFKTKKRSLVWPRTLLPDQKKRRLN